MFLINIYLSRHKNTYIGKKNIKIFVKIKKKIMKFFFLRYITSKKNCTCKKCFIFITEVQLPTCRTKYFTMTRNDKYFTRKLENFVLMRYCSLGSLYFFL